MGESFLKKLRNYFSNLNFITYFIENEGDVDKVMKSVAAVVAGGTPLTGGIGSVFGQFMVA